jgi:CHAT domain-containing protein/Tfp pilus assembly protein PilF
MQAFRICLTMAMATGPLLWVPHAIAQQTDVVKEPAAPVSDFVPLAKRAHALHVEGKTSEAIVVAERAERQAALRALPQTTEVADAWNSLGMTLFELGYDLRARSAYEKAWSIADAILGPEAAFRSSLLNNLGQVEMRLGHSTRAVDYLEQALALRRRLAATKPYDLAVSMDNLALAYQGIDELDKAEELHQKALEIFEQKFGLINTDTATASGNLASVYGLKRDYRRAEVYRLRALDAHQRLFGFEDSRTVLDLTTLAQLYLEMGDQGRTDTLVNVLLKAGGPAPGKQHMSVANAVCFLATQAQLHWQLGLAERLAARAVEMFTAIVGPNGAETLKGLSLLAHIQAARSDFASAEKTFRSVLKEYSAHGQSMESVAAMVQLAKVYRNWRAYPSAIELLTKAVDVIRGQEGVHSEELASALGNLAEVYYEADNPSAAEKTYDKALAAIQDEKSSQHRPWLLHGRALLWYHLGRYEQARQGLEQARDIWSEASSKEHPFVATTLANLALVTWAQGDRPKTVDLLSTVSEIRERELQRTLTVGTEQQRLAYARDMQADLFKMLSFCFAPERCAGDAARLSATLLLQRKGRVLDAMVDTTRQIRNQFSPEDRKLLYRLEAVRRSISEQMYPTLVSGEAPKETTELSALLDQERELQRAVSFRSAGYRASLEPVTVEGVRRVLPRDAILIEFVKYSVFEPIRTGRGIPWRGERYAALALKGETDPRWFDLGPAGEIENAVQAFRLRLRNRNTAYTTSEAERLYSLIIKPLKEALKPEEDTAGKDPQLLLIAPDGTLNLIPFGLLKDKDGSALDDVYVVNILSSGRDLLQQRSSAPAKDVVVFADPDFNAGDSGASVNTPMRLQERGDFAPIPGTRKEVEELTRLLEGVRSFTDQKATVAALKAVERPAVLHIATHGVFARVDHVERQTTSDTLHIGDSSYFLFLSGSSTLDNPLLFSGLALAGANKGERSGGAGIISALEISSLQLQGTELVVLSACETGLGTTRHGEEFSGLRRALSIAGAARQVTSLWKVDDTATAALMAKYYSLLLNGKGTADALQLAQQHIRKEHPEWSHPYFWAAFISSGDWKPIRTLVPRAVK